MILNSESNVFVQYIDNGPNKEIIFDDNSFIQYEDNSLNTNIIIDKNISILDYIKNKHIKEVSPNLLSKSKLQLRKFDSAPNTIFDNLTEFKRAVVKKFKISILSEELDFGVIGKTTKNMEEFLLINPDYTVNAITQLALDNFDDVNLVYSVLHTLAHVKYNLIAPAGVTFALTASRHKNIEIQDFSIQCFDMWESKDSLGFLKVIEIDTPWLNDYLQEVITNIESIDG